MVSAFKTDSPRYERKFLLHAPQRLSLRHLIKLHPATFSKIYTPRQINNVYYDTADFSHFRENLAGVSPRRKVRVRWYGEFETVTKPILEIKSKDGEVVTKSSRALPSFPLRRVKDFFLETSYPYQPVLKNSYNREYFISADRKLRLTVDTDITFDDLGTSLLQNPVKSLSYTIVELKYSILHEDDALAACKYFPFRLSKLSKYEQGIGLCYPHLTIVWS